MTSLAHFNGPSELLPAWEGFVDRYTQNGTAKDRVEEARLLHEFITTAVTPGEFLAQHQKMGFARLKSAIDNICAAQSNEAGEKGSERELNHYIATQLLHKWIALLAEQGLYPPPVSAIPKAIKEQRDALRREPAGGLIASAIASICLKTILGSSKIVKNRLKGAAGFDPHAADSEAMNIFDKTLFSFDDKEGDQERSTGTRFQIYLYRRIQSNTPRGAFIDSDGPSLDRRFDDGKGEGASWHERLSDANAASPALEASKRDLLARVLQIMEKELPARERDILEYRFGLLDGHAHTLEETGELFGLTRERVRQIEQKSLRLVQAHVEGEAPTPKLPKPQTPPVINGAPKRPRSFAKPVTMPPPSPEIYTPELSTEHETAQWNVLLEARHRIGTAIIPGHREAEAAALDLFKALLMHAPDTADGALEATTEGMSYNAVLQRFGGFDLRRPDKIADALVCDPEWRKEIAGYLAHAPAASLSQQLQDIYKPNHFLPSASFGECLDAYVFCGGRELSEFLTLYCQAKGHMVSARGPGEHHSGKLVPSPKALAAELNDGMDAGNAISFNTVWHWMNVRGKEKRPHKVSEKDCEVIYQKYGFTEAQRNRFAFINGNLGTLDNAKNILDREELKLKNAASPDTHACALTVLKGLLQTQPGLTPEGLSKRIKGAISPPVLQKWVRENKIYPNTLLPCIDDVAQVLVPHDPALARRAANLMLGLPASGEMTFHEAIGFARTQGYTIAEFFDMRRYQLRDVIKRHWDATHDDAEKFNGFRAFEQFVMAGKPEDMHLSRGMLERIRVDSLADVPPANILDFIAGKLGASDDADRIAFRQLCYAHALNAGQKKVAMSLDMLEAAGDPARKQECLRRLLLDAQERDGAQCHIDLVRNMLAYAARKSIAVPVTESTFNAYLVDAMKQGKPMKRETASLAATYLFPDDERRKDTLYKHLAGLGKLAPTRNSQASWAETAARSNGAGGKSNGLPSH
jgi:hypothetical protein